VALTTQPTASPTLTTRPALTPETGVAQAPSSQPVATPVVAQKPLPPEPLFKPESPIVQAVQPLKETGAFDELIYPMTPSTHAAIIRTRGAEGDVIESWSLQPPKQTATARFNHAAGQRDRYILSPDGDLLVRIVDWPKLSAQVWSFGRQQVIQSIDLDRRYGQGTLIGFANNRQFVLQWQQGADYGLEYLDAVTGRRLRQVVLPRGQRDLNGYAFSPDGRFIAMPVQYDQGAYIALYEFPGGQPGRRFKIEDIDPHGAVLPSGIAFSPDGRRLAVLFQQNGNGLLLCWHTAGVIPMVRYLYPNGFGFTNRHELTGTALQWLDGGAWLLWGRGIIDTDTGRLLGQIGLDDVLNQQWIEPGLVQLTVSSPDSSQRQLMQVRFSPDRLADAKHAAAQ
jgi:WD40 repeat protein